MDPAILPLLEKTSYLHPSRYISGRIVEYDIESANITMLHKYHKINNTYFEYLSKLPKIYREIEIGNLIKHNKSIYDTIQFGIKEAKKSLFEYNDIKLPEIARIANDAVYINRSYNLCHIIFDKVKFKKKSIHTVMMKLNQLIIFFNIDLYNNINIEVKGMNEENQLLHSEYLLGSIAQIIFLIEKDSIESALIYFEELYDNYLNLKLPKEFYRCLDSRSLYQLKKSCFYMSYIEDINDIDINYNLYILRELYSILMERFQITLNKKTMG